MSVPLTEADLLDVPVPAVEIVTPDVEFTTDWDDPRNYENAPDTTNDEMIARQLQLEAEEGLARTPSELRRHQENLKQKSYSGAQFGLHKKVKPYFIYSIIVIDIFILFFELLANSKREGNYFDDFTINPFFGPSLDTLVFMGAKRADLIVEGDWWRMFVPIFLHGGILHLLFNLIFLHSFGTGLEAEFGHGRIAYIFFISGVVGILTSCLFNPTLVSVGASGAAYGLIGAAWSEFWLNFGFYKETNWKSWLCQLAFGTIVNLCLGLIPTLDNFAHIGGFIAGFFSGLTVLTLPRYDYFLEVKPEHVYQVLLRSLGIICTPVVLIIMIIVLYVGIDANNYCPWCQLLTCVPTPFWLCDIECDEGFDIVINVDGSASISCPRDVGIVSVPAAEVGDIDGDADAQFQLCEIFCLGRE